MTGLTAKQFRVLAFIQDYIATNGYSPNLREIGAGVGCTSVGNVHRYLTALAERGHITWLPSRARSIAIVEQARAA